MAKSKKKLTREVYKYPYYAKIEDETKIFLSDEICEKVIRIIYRNGQIFCIIKDRITHKKKEIAFSAAFTLAGLFEMPKQARPIGVTPIVPSTHKIHRSAPQHFYQYAPTISERVYKVKFIPARETVPLMFLYQTNHINEEFLKKLRNIRGGNNILVDIFWMSLLLYAITQYPEQAAGFIQQLGRFNAPGLVDNQPGYFNRPSCSSTVIQSQSDSDNSIQWQWQGTICSQTESFRKVDGTLDIDQGYQEVLRRGRDSEDFECSRERFVELCTENEQITTKGIQEAITALQLEADGIVSNVRRDPVAAQNGIFGLDFLIDGPNGETHLEVKGPVDSTIKLAENQRPSIRKQARSIGRKIHYQLNKWIQTDQKVTKPASADKVLIVVDLFNVSVGEKHQMQTGIQAEAQKAAVTRETPTVMNLIFINNIINR